MTGSPWPGRGLEEHWPQRRPSRWRFQTVGRSTTFTAQVLKLHYETWRKDVLSLFLFVENLIDSGSSLFTLVRLACTERETRDRCGRDSEWE